MTTHGGLELRATDDRTFDEILTPDALEFVAALQREFGPRRIELLKARAERRARLAAGEMLDFLPGTVEIRESDWTVAPVPADIQQRWVEITGPTERKMTINALNSGADGFMADFEDANAPTWRNMVEGHINLRDAIEGTITYDGSDGRHYELGENSATLLVRPRGWHLPERHFLVDGDPVAGAFFDFGMYVLHNARNLLRNGSGPYFYLPKMESHLEARLWNDVFNYAQDALGMERGTIKATVLIETLPAAFEMDEILYELRDHSAGLNAGRWDYIFSAIKCFRDRPEMVLPNRVDVTMTVPFMRAYTELLAATCHRRGAHAMGGMAALIPSRKGGQEENQRALDGVRADKDREVKQGYDGTWVAHPDLVPVAREIFEQGLGGAPNQLERQRGDVNVTAGQLLDLASTPGSITEQGLRTDVSVGFQYISFWLGGRGAAAINNLMEDAATAEISRSQIWQWIRHRATLEDGRTVTRELVLEILDEETTKIRDTVGEDTWRAGRPVDTREIFEAVALSDELLEFLTLPAYQYLD
jgi:malate synthase